MKKALLQFQIQLKKLGRAEIYLITSNFGFSSKKNDFRAVSYISQFTLLTVCHKKKQESSNYHVDKTLNFARVHIYLT